MNFVEAMRDPKLFGAEVPTRGRVEALGGFLSAKWGLPMGV
jgi:hypothetical protein